MDKCRAPTSRLGLYFMVIMLLMDSCEMRRNLRHIEEKIDNILKKETKPTSDPVTPSEPK